MGKLHQKKAALIVSSMLTLFVLAYFFIHHRETTTSVKSILGNGKNDTAAIVPGADPSSFKELSNGYSLDKNNVYYNSTIVQSADPAHFQQIADQETEGWYCGFSYWKDERGVYLKGKRIESADPQTFKVIKYTGRHCAPGQYSTDKNHVFYNDTLLNEADVSTFTYKGGVVATDSKGMFYAGSKCVTTSTYIENKKIGYGLRIPKDWNYNFDYTPGQNSIFSCISGSGFAISKGPVRAEQAFKKIGVNSQLVPNSTITGWTFDGAESVEYAYQIEFPQSNSSFAVYSGEPLEDLPLLSSLVPIANY